MSEESGQFPKGEVSQPPHVTSSTLERLKSTSLFSGVDIEGVEHILRGCKLIQLEEEELLIRRGVLDDSLYVILEGELSVHVDAPGDDPIACLGPGDSVGEISALDKKPRSAAVCAVGRASVLRIESPDFWSLMTRSHQLSLNMLHMLGERLRGNNAKIVDTRRLQELYKRNATTDPLTGLYNRRGLDELGERLIRRLAIKQEPLSLLMVDVDHFKRFNDEHGHQAGDFVLFVVAQLLKNGVRPTDFVARYGGEEFTVLLPEAPIDGAVVAADRLRESVRQTALEMPDGLALPSVSASFGAVQYREGMSLEDLIREADGALYEAKRNGRDRVERVVA